jgi:basic membrane lipoprotein Med (substrate-binding protein (PBP1-ABC) superfamily)
MSTGGIPIYKTAEELQEKIDEYVKLHPMMTITGLCYYLGFSSRQSFYDMEKRKELTYTIKRARLMIENSYEESLRLTGKSSDIFALKNFGWKDKQDIVQTNTNVNLNYEEYRDKLEQEKKKARETKTTEEEEI